MVNGITSKEAKDEFDATAKSFMEDLQWAEEKLARSNAMVHELGVENSGLKAKNAELKAEVARLTAALNGK